MALLESATTPKRKTKTSTTSLRNEQTGRHRPARRPGVLGVEASGSPVSVMGGPDRAPALGIMGGPDRGIRIDVMGGADPGPRTDVMGGPDHGPRLDVMGHSDPRFVDSLFTDHALAARPPHQ